MLCNSIHEKLNKFCQKHKMSKQMRISNCLHFCQKSGYQKKPCTYLIWTLLVVNKCAAATIPIIFRHKSQSHYMERDHPHITST